MVYENNIPKTETVYELKNEVPSFEEFMKTYQEDEKTENSYYYEIDSNGDIRVIRPYGPGFWEGVGEVAKFGGKVAGGMVVGGAVMGASSSSVASKGANLALNSALSNGSEELLRVWFYTRATQMGYHLGSKSKQALEGFASFYHGLHEGKYEKDCPICNGNFDKYFWL